MKIHFYGTGASEGVPALFCECKYCRQIKRLGGKNYRTRTCAQIDEDILIDFSMDSYAQVLFRGLNLPNINHMLITHSHEDHLFTTGLMQIMPPMAFYDRERTLNVYGNAAVIMKIQAGGEQNREKEILYDYLKLHTICVGQEFTAGDYRITALPANHDKREDCFIYVICHDGRLLLYGHDSAQFGEEAWRALKAFRFDCVVLDCTMVEETGVFEGHMGLPDNIAVRERMIREGMATLETKFIATHFVHTFNPVHERIAPIFAEKGFLTSYDGLEIEF